MYVRGVCVEGALLYRESETAELCLRDGRARSWKKNGREKNIAVARLEFRAHLKLGVQHVKRETLRFFCYTTTCLMCIVFDVLSTVISVHLKVSTKWTAVTVYPFFFLHIPLVCHIMSVPQEFCSLMSCGYLGLCVREVEHKAMGSVNCKRLQVISKNNIYRLHQPKGECWLHIGNLRHSSV